MAAVTFTYRVFWHHEVGGKKVFDDQIDILQAAANDGPTVKAVLTGNSRQKASAYTTIVIDSVINVDPSGVIA